MRQSILKAFDVRIPVDVLFVLSRSYLACTIRVLMTGPLQEFIGFSIDGFELPCSAWYSTPSTSKIDEKVENEKTKDEKEVGSATLTTVQEKKKRVDKQMTKSEQEEAIKQCKELVASHDIINLLESGPRKSFGVTRWNDM
jgi:hypothetical protein